MNTYALHTDGLRAAASRLRAGDKVLLSGTVYTSRDAAHKRMWELLDTGGSLPFPVEGSAVYYVGPTPERPGQVIGSAGPTTSGRMDAYSPRLLDLGQLIMIGKGKRDQSVKDAVVRNGAVYLAALGGAGALMRDRAFFDSILEEYFKTENHDFFIASAATEAIGYCRWPRLREVVEFSKRMGYTRLGLAFCAGLHREAEVVDRVLRQNGFQVASVICKTGSIPKDRAGVPPEYRVRPGTYEVMCNPIAQAELLNRAETQFNICLGLCVGHDSLFYRYSQAPVTTLVAKDRATGNNPVAAIYCADSYFKTRLDADQP